MALFLANWKTAAAYQAVSHAMSRPKFLAAFFFRDGGARTFAYQDNRALEARRELDRAEFTDVNDGREITIQRALSRDDTISLENSADQTEHWPEVMATFS